jgi:hypothetical protein
MGEFNTAAFGTARVAGLARFLSISYIILCNLLLINLLIALLNNTFTSVFEQVQQKYNFHAYKVCIIII